MTGCPVRLDPDSLAPADLFDHVGVDEDGAAAVAHAYHGNSSGLTCWVGQDQPGGMCSRPEGDPIHETLAAGEDPERRMSAGTDAARAVVRGMPVRRPGLDLRPSHTLDKTLTEWSCTCGRYGVLLTEQARDELATCPGGAL